MASPISRLAVGPGWLEGLVTQLKQRGTRVMAPVQEDDAVEFRPIQSVAEMATDYVNTRTPVKAILFPGTEVLLTFEKPPGDDVEFSGVEAEAEPTVVLGARPCDLSGVDVLDRVFDWDYHEEAYDRRRAATTFVGFACTRANDSCFCQSVNLGPDSETGSDVLVRHRTDGGAVLEVWTERGQALVADLDATPADGNEELAPLAKAEASFDVERITAWLKTHFEDDLWTDVSLKCLGCATCSFLCPTCHCFDIVDESDWRHGERRRNWDCCSFAQFTKHASGHNPRPDQTSRCRNRVMHKFDYFVERFGRLACVGCGRCTRLCGAGQNVVEVLAAIDHRAAEGE